MWTIVNHISSGPNSKLEEVRISLCQFLSFQETQRVAETWWLIIYVIWTDSLHRTHHNFWIVGWEKQGCYISYRSYNMRYTNCTITSCHITKQLAGILAAWLVLGSVALSSSLELSLLESMQSSFSKSENKRWKQNCIVWQIFLRYLKNKKL